MYDLSGRVALITGASRGIGRGAAIALAQHGARVVINHSNSAGQANEVVQQIEAAGGEALAIQADVSKRPDVEAMVARILETYGRLDILINNAGVAVDVPIAQMTDEAWDRVIDVNLRGTFLCSQIVAPTMLAQKHGKIITVSAATALRGRKNGANFCAAKAGIIALTKCLALELAPYVQVNSLLPGFTTTQEIIDRFRLDDDEARQRILDTIPMQRFAEVEDIAVGALILASDASNFMTGQMLCINGGSFMG